LLLDETVAHLDVTRRGALAQALEALNTQVWLTGTDAADFQVFERFAQHFEVRDAEVIKR
jgi:DNA replication and repair protein RecF